MTMERVGIEQDVPNLAKRHAQQNRAEADITAARARSQADLRRIRVATALAWIDAYYAQKRLEAMDVVLERLRRLPGAAVSAVAAGTGRSSEEHTSELQSLMRISYHSVSLKKKKPTQTPTTTSTRHYM